MNIPTRDLYFESTTNKTFPWTNQTEGGFDINGDGNIDTLTKGGNTSAGFVNPVPFLSAIISVGLAVLL